MKIGDRVFARGYIDEIRKDTVIIRNAGGYFGTIPSEVITGELPSAEPERKTGKWNFIGDNMFECTSCGVVYTTSQLNGLRNYDTDPYAPKFCPNCGADMRGEQHETD